MMADGIINIGGQQRRVVMALDHEIDENDMPDEISGTFQIPVDPNEAEVQNMLLDTKNF